LVGKGKKRRNFRGYAVITPKLNRFLPKKKKCRKTQRKEAGPISLKEKGRLGILFQAKGRTKKIKK